jgi:hypothetical protein
MINVFLPRGRFSAKAKQVPASGWPRPDWANVMVFAAASPLPIGPGKTERVQSKPPVRSKPAHRASATAADHRTESQRTVENPGRIYKRACGAVFERLAS